MIETEYNIEKSERLNMIPSLFLEFVRFVIIGVLNTVVDLISLNIMAGLLSIYDGIGFSVIKSCSFLVAVICSYFLNKWWTFKDKSKEKQGRKMCHFLMISMTGMVINVVAATLVVMFLKVPVNNLFSTAFLSEQVWINIGALSGSAAGLLWNFSGYKLFVFKTPNQEADSCES